MSKRVPVYMSVQEMKDAREALQLIYSLERNGMSEEETKRRLRHLDVLHEEIERNTEPGEVSNG